VRISGRKAALLGDPSALNHLEGFFASLDSFEKSVQRNLAEGKFKSYLSMKSV
jgi:hypothetical protein